MRSTTNALQIAGAMSLTTLAAGLGAWVWLPEHIQYWGTPVMPKEVGIILIPVLGIVLTLVGALVVSCDPLCAVQDSSSRAAICGAIILPSLFSLPLQVIVLWAALTNHELGSTPLVFLFSILMLILGIVFNYVEQNHVVGVRDVWTLQSARVWEDTHALASKIFALAGVVGIVLVWFIPGGFWQMIFVCNLGLIPSLIAVIYSYVIREDAQYQYIIR